MAAAPGRVVLDMDPRWSVDAGYKNRDLTASARREAGAEAWARALVHDAQRAGRLSATAAGRLRRALETRSPAQPWSGSSGSWAVFELPKGDGRTRASSAR